MTLPPHNAREWLEQLSQHGILRWHHGNNNYGLLLPVLLELNGWQGDILVLSDALPCSAKEIGVQDILAVMSALGYRIYQERIHTHNLKPEDLPGLFIPTSKQSWQEGIVLREIAAYGVIWHDGREQRRGGLLEQEGMFYRFERIQEEENEDDQRRWIGQLATRFKPLMVHAAILSLVMHLFTLAMPMFSMAVYDRVPNKILARLSELNIEIAEQIDRLEKMLDAMAQAEAQPLIIEQAHAVKSAALSLGYFRLAALMAQIEHAVKEKQFRNSPMHWATIADCLRGSGFENL